MSGKAYIYLEDKVKELLAAHENEFRSGRAVADGNEVRFDAEWMCDKIGWTSLAITDTLRRMAQDPTNHIVLRFNEDLSNAGVIHIDSVVLEFIRSNEFDVIMGSPGFDAQYISDQLGLGRNFVACALRRLAEDPKNFLGLINVTSNNPAPVRDYGVSRDAEYATAEQ